jgi:hypothetical protein
LGYLRFTAIKGELEMATKAQALAWLAIQPPIHALGTVTLVNTSADFGDNIYRVNVRKLKPVTLDCVRYENIDFVVVDEGLPTEAAYFLGNNNIAWDNEHENPPPVV